MQLIVCLTNFRSWIYVMLRRFILRKERNASISKTYVVIQDSRKDDTTLMLVDRRKSKKYWWTHDFSLAYKGKKEEVKKVTKRLHMNNVRIVELEKYLRES